ncbi:hypothetical protein NYR55_01950 [Sphingomonas sp. BGYR3]|uniref:hypothetical protein n=1 Tax=Sphingomonas sp. BGYR3 TaxID=2975483 RepID=UPI0021A606D6|nr:hypothetical protein [Sphingomonas sp. BGYR3]MDG5487389.1 hypothetical protein [Sphingomonas sp. BGYR3]
MNKLSIFSLTRPVTTATVDDSIDKAMNIHLSMASCLLLLFMSQINLSGCSIPSEKMHLAVAKPSQMIAGKLHSTTETKKLFIIPGSPRETMGLIINSASTESFSQLHNRFMTALSSAPQSLPIERNIFTFVSYESGKCVDNPKPVGVTLGIFQCPPGTTYHGYAATQTVMNSSNQRVDIPIQDVDLYKYRVNDVLPVLKRDGFTIKNDIADLMPPAVNHFPDPYVTILAEKPNQSLYVIYDIGAPGAPSNALVLGLGVYVIEE